MKHEGLQYLQCLFVKEQATANNLLWILEKCKNMRDGWRRDFINCDFLIRQDFLIAHGTVFCSFLFCSSLFHIAPLPTMLLHFSPTVHPAP
jgi:hypothetical protein